MTIDGGPKTEGRVEVRRTKVKWIRSPPGKSGHHYGSRNPDANSREAIGTWPTPEKPALETDRESPEAIIDSNDGTSINTAEEKIASEVIIDSNDSLGTVDRYWIT